MKINTKNKVQSLFFASKFCLASIYSAIAFAPTYAAAEAETLANANVGEILAQDAPVLTAPPRALERSGAAIQREDLLPPVELSPLRPGFLPETPPPACGEGERLALANDRWFCVDIPVSESEIPRSRVGGASRVWVVPLDSGQINAGYSAVAPGFEGGEINIINWDRNGALILDEAGAGRFLIGGGDRAWLGGLGPPDRFGWTVLISETPIVIWGATGRTLFGRSSYAYRYAVLAVPVECSDPDEFKVFERACMFYEREAARD